MMISKILISFIVSLYLTSPCFGLSPDVDKQKTIDIYEKHFANKENFELLKLSVDKIEYYFIHGSTVNFFDDAEHVIRNRLHKLNKFRLFKFLSEGKDSVSNYHMNGFRDGIFFSNDLEKYTLISYVAVNDIQILKDRQLSQNGENCIQEKVNEAHPPVHSFDEFEFSTVKSFGEETKSSLLNNSEEYLYLIEQIALIEEAVDSGHANQDALMFLYDLYILKPDFEKAHKIRTRLFELSINNRHND